MKHLFFTTYLLSMCVCPFNADTMSPENWINQLVQKIWIIHCGNWIWRIWRAWNNKVYTGGRRRQLVHFPCWKWIFAVDWRYFYSFLRRLIARFWESYRKITSVSASLKYFCNNNISHVYIYTYMIYTPISVNHINFLFSFFLCKDLSRTLILPLTLQKISVFFFHKRLSQIIISFNSKTEDYLLFLILIYINSIWFLILFN